MDSETGSSFVFEGVNKGGSVYDCVTAVTIEGLDRL